MEKRNQIVKPIDDEMLWGEPDREVITAAMCPHLGEVCELWDDSVEKCMAPLVTAGVCIKLKIQ